MPQNLYAYKAGDIQSGNWSWAIGADSPHGGKMPLCVATVNFHGAIAAGYDHEKLAPLFAAAPDLLAQLESLVAGNYGQPSGVTVPALDGARAAIAKAKGESK